ncbi:energy-coupling factor ABC transporter permease [Actinoplanes sp. CA-131856]
MAMVPPGRGDTSAARCAPNYTTKRPGEGANGIISGPVSAIFVVFPVAALAVCVHQARADALGGTTELPLPWISGTMAGVHVLIGIGEGVIAATTVATVARVRPDLVYALRRFRKPAGAETGVTAGPAVATDSA